MLTSQTVRRLPYADHIVAIGSDGKVSEQGSFDELKANGGYMSTFTFTSVESRTFSRQEELQAVQDTDTTKESVPLVAETEPAALEEDSTRRTGDVSVYLYYIRAIGWIPTIIFLVCITCYVFGISFPSKYMSVSKSKNDDLTRL